MQLKNREQGVALVAAVLTMVVVAGILTMIFARTLNEVRTTRESREIVQTLLLARGGVNVGVAMLNGPMREQVDQIVANTSSNASRWAYDPTASSTSKRPDPGNVADNLKALVVGKLQTSANQIACSFNGYGSLAGKISVRIYFTGTACNTAIPNNVTLPTGRYYSGEGRDATSIGKQAYAIPFAMVAEGSESGYRRNVVIQGEYVFEIGRSSFARYAYFTNREVGADGTNIFFTDQTLIDGPVHTNGNFSFAYDPWFGGAVSSAGCTNIRSDGKDCASSTNGGATFRETYCYLRNCTYTRNTFVKDENMQPNDQAPYLGGTAPTFEGGVAWNARFVALPENSNDQKNVAKGFNSNGLPRLDTGITFGSSLYSLTLQTVGADGKAPTKKTDGTWTPESSFQIIKGCTSATACTIYRVDKNNVMSSCAVTSAATETRCYTNFKTAGTWTPSLLPFNGVVYTDGAINRLGGPARSTANDPSTAAPAVAKFSQLNLTSTGQVRLTGDLKYEDRPVKGNPSRNDDRTVKRAEYVNPAAQNILGIFTSGSDIVVGNQNSSADLNAPSDMEVDSVLMSSTGSIAVENYNNGSARGDFKLLGGMIQNRRGAFGTFSGYGVMNTGFNRIYTYDKRMQDGLTPPFFPTTGQDQVNWVRTTSYGQREQVY